MSTPSDLAHELPWGFHDAFLESVAVDLTKSRAVLVFSLPISERQETWRRAQVDVEGLYRVRMNGPDDDEVGSNGLWLSGWELCEAPSEAALPEGVWDSRIGVNDANYEPIHIAARHVTLTWLGDPESVGGPRAFFPGDVVELAGDGSSGR